MSAGCSRPPASRSAVKAFRARRQFAPRTVNGSAMMTQARMTTAAPATAGARADSKRSACSVESSSSAAA